MALHVGTPDSRRAVAPHSAGVGPDVAVADTFVVAGGDHWGNVFTVHEREHADFLTLQELLHKHPVPGRAERLLLHAQAHGRKGLVAGLADNHALARCQAIGFDHDRYIAAPCVLDRLVQGLECGGCPGGDVVAKHQVLGESLAALDPGRAPGRAEDGEPGVLKPVDDAFGQRCFRTDDRQIDAVCTGVSCQAIDVTGTDADVFSDLAGACVSRCDL